MKHRRCLGSLWHIMQSVCWISVAVAQSSLQPGDIAITGVNMDDPDEVSMLFLVAVENGTELKFSDNGWKADNSWRSGEAIQTWLALRDYIPGEEIIISLPDLLLSASGDQVIVFQNEANMLTAINNEGPAVWQADATSANTSSIPTGLVNGLTCVALDETDNICYDRRVTSGTRSEVLSAINDPANWSGSDANRQSLSTVGFTLTDSSLPVELVAWNARSSGGSVVLSWCTESEIENQGFILERQTVSASIWTEIATFVTDIHLLGQGSTARQTNYQWVDTQVNPGETCSYRLCDVNYQGKVTVHPTLKVTVCAEEADLRSGGVQFNTACPNPFNPALRFSFGLGTEVPHLDVAVYDLHGRLIKALARGSFDPGLYELGWDGTDEAGRDVASGVYLLQLRLLDQNHCQRVTLMR